MVTGKRGLTVCAQCDALAALPHVGLACTREEYQAFDRRLAGLDM